MTEVLITGGLGFIGGHVARAFLDKGAVVTVVDNCDETIRGIRDRQATLRRLQHPNLRVRLGSVSEYAIETRLDRFDVIVHAAGSVGLIPSWKNPQKYLANNRGETEALANAVRHSTSTARLVHLSTSSVYGELALGSEDLPLNPTSPYGTTKLLAEEAWRGDDAIAARIVILRLFSVFGPAQRPDMAWSRFIAASMRGEPVTLTGDGNQARSFTYIDDVARAIQLASSTAAPPGIYNICGEQSLSLNHGLDVLERLIGRPIERLHKPRSRGDQSHTAGDGRRARALLGFQPSVDFSDGLARQVRAQMNADD